jgi:hypothetical protein
MLTQELLHNLFEYKDGDLYWKVDRKANKTKGTKAGCLDGRGYLQTKINNVLYKNHRIIFMMHFGKLPFVIDHIDGNPLNNLITNLREATTSQNSMNAKIYCTNNSGIKNVCWHKSSQKWIVKLQAKGKRYHFGTYDDIELAELVAIEARNKYFQNFARHL